MMISLNHSKLFSALVFLCFLIITTTLSANLPAEADNKDYLYKVSPVSNSFSINADWNKQPWTGTEASELKNYMGDKPDHFPETQFKVRYDEKNIYVIFQVKDNYVKAIAKKTHGRVWEDSCVEFFFTPGSDVSKGYFNLETNCKGVMLLGYTKNSNGDRGAVAEKDCKKITIANSLKRDVQTEITEPVTWSIEYAIPFSMLDKYIKVDKPSKGVRWRANFYKCGDKTSHPHWLTWAPVINPVPKFHIPEYFGWLEFQ